MAKEEKQLSRELPIIQDAVDSRYPSDVSHELSLLSANTDYLSAEDRNTLMRAFSFAYYKHDESPGRLRKDGKTHFMCHPSATATILTEIQHINGEKFRPDIETLEGALLHDTIEDTKTTPIEIADHFGPKVAQLTLDVTDETHYDREKENTMRNLMRKFESLDLDRSDLRALLIKMADRMHNLITIGPLPRISQLRNAHETLEIYVPLARLLHIPDMADKLTYLAYSIISPELAKETNDRFLRFKEQKIDSDRDVINMAGSLGDVLFVTSEPVSFLGSSIASTNGDSVRETPYQYNVVTETTDAIHRITGKLQRYLNMHGMHVQVITYPEKCIVTAGTITYEIKSVEQNRIDSASLLDSADYSIDHIQRDENRVLLRSRLQPILDSIHEFERSGEIDEVIDSITERINAPIIIVFTPNGDPIPLGSGATVLDFAAQIHEEILMQSTGFVVNGRRVASDHTLSSGDKITIETSDQILFSPERLIQATSERTLRIYRKYFEALHTIAGLASENDVASLSNRLKDIYAYFLAHGLTLEQMKTADQEITHSLLTIGANKLKEGIDDFNIYRVYQHMDASFKNEYGSIEDFLRSIAYKTAQEHEISSFIEAAHAYRREYVIEMPVIYMTDEPDALGKVTGLVARLGLNIASLRIQQNALGSQAGIHISFDQPNMKYEEIVKAFIENGFNIAG